MLFASERPELLSDSCIGILRTEVSEFYMLHSTFITSVRLLKRTALIIGYRVLKHYFKFLKMLFFPFPSRPIVLLAEV